MPRKTKVADVYRKQGTVYRNEKTFGDQFFEFVGGAIVIIFILGVLVAIF